jgi:hypothetical protein
MGLFSDITGQVRDQLVVKPIVNYLRQEAEKKAELEKAQRSSGYAMNPSGPLIRDQLMMSSGYAQYGSTRSKPGASVDYVTLRRFSEQYDVARAVVNRRKRQLNQLEWEIVPIDSEQPANKTLQAEIKAQVDDLGGYRVRFREFLDTMVEDLLVLDALAIYKRPNLGGELHSLEVIDASTIQLRVDQSGGTPEPPEIAYKQVIRGSTLFEFTADEMYYEMMNPRSSSPYGLSPLESLVLTVSTALKSDLYNMHMLTEGNIPEGMFSVPENWTSDQIRQFQEVWDSMLSGDTRATSRMKFVPPGTYTPTMKPEDMRYKELQEWLMKKTCMLYEIQPQELGFTDTVNKSTGEVQEEIGERSGLVPLVRFFEELFADIVQIDLGYPQYRLKFLGVDDDNDRELAEINQIRIFSGQATVDEIRQEEGKEPLGVTKPFVVAAGTPTFIDDESIATAAQQKADAAAAMAEATKNKPDNLDGGTGEGKGESTPTDQTGDGEAGADPSDVKPAGNNKSADPLTTQLQLVTELRTFRKYALARFNAGKPLRYFESQILPESATREMNERLQKSKTKDDVRAVFREYMEDYQVNFLADVADLKKDLAKVLQ